MLISDFVNSYPNLKGVFILDSVSGAVRLALEPERRFGKANVSGVHRLSSDEAQRDALRCFTVGTPTTLCCTRQGAVRWVATKRTPFG